MEFHPLNYGKKPLNVRFIFLTLSKRKTVTHICDLATIWFEIVSRSVNCAIPSKMG